MAAPLWRAARNGLPGDTNAVNASAEINQFLATHGAVMVYEGSALVTPIGSGLQMPPPAPFAPLTEVSQRFTPGATAIGRVSVPVLPTGNAADLVVQLYTDSGGTPGTLLATTRIPAHWITVLASETGLPATGPLQTAVSNTVAVGPWSTAPYAAPATATSSLSTATPVVSGNYLILVGGDDLAGGSVSGVYTIAYQGADSISQPQQQPSLPVATSGVAAAVAGDSIVVAGGNTTGSTVVATTYSAAWDSGTGTVGAWSAQADMPVALVTQGCAASGTTVYLVGGVDSSIVPHTTVLYATVDNGQIDTWNTGPPLPQPLSSSICMVISGYLVCIGGTNATSNVSAVYYAPINADGSLGTWITGPSVPVPVATGTANGACTPALLPGVGVILPSAISGGPTTDVQALTWDGYGPGSWRRQTGGYTGTQGTSVAAWSSGTGTWQVFSIAGGQYGTTTAYAVPRISVPLPVSGLTAASTYHLVLSQHGADLNNYLSTPIDAAALPNDALYLSGGTWHTETGYSVPISVYDTSVSGRLIHTWEDAGARITRLLYRTDPYQQLIGALTSTALADGTTLNAECAAIVYSQPGGLPTAVTPV